MYAHVGRLLRDARHAPYERPRPAKNARRGKKLWAPSVIWQWAGLAVSRSPPDRNSAWIFFLNFLEFKYPGTLTDATLDSNIMKARHTLGEFLQAGIGEDGLSVGHGS
jgi:hypothetical protein